ncbi:MAG TPA: chemotaxis protein CheW [Syntrophorhabdaceae bacterium]|jgi:chemotaxis-related protein WspB
MLFLLFQIRSEHYCMDVSRVIEVVPMVRFNLLPHAPPYVAGLFNYRGTIVPVIDLSALLYEEPCRPLLSTRILLVDYTGADKKHHILGLLVERATETVSCKAEDFTPPGIEVEGARFLGDAMYRSDGMVQRVEVERILPENVQAYLFAAGREEE